MTKTKELNELQIKFLEALFGEAKGDILTAKRLAGYSEQTKNVDIIRVLREEIIEQAHLILAMNSPRASLEMIGLMVDPNQAGATTKIKAVTEILNRVGVVSEKNTQDVNLKVPSGGLFIMPAKGSNSPSPDESKETTDEDS